MEYTKENFFTDEQLKAIKAVEHAMKKAGSLGIQFWDNYGSIVNNFSTGNADDPLYFDIIKVNPDR